MSWIDDLVSELAPAGVRHVALGEVAGYSDGRVNAEDLDETNFVGVDNLLPQKGGKIDASYLPNTPRLTAYAPGDVLLGNIRPYLKKIWLADESGGCSGDVLAIRITAMARSILDADFLYYLLSSDGFFAYNMQHAKGAKMPRGNKVAILGFRIPVPPIAVQREIVRILDHFTEVEAELEAELEARRRQYNYYRDHLFTFNDTDVKWVRLSEVCAIYDGTHQTPRYVDHGVKFVSVENINALHETTKYISQDDFDKLYKTKPRKNDVFMTRIGTIGVCSVVDDDQPLAYYVTLALLRPNPRCISSAYLKHFIESGFGVRELRRRTLVTAVPIKINLGEIGNLRVAMPPVEEQERIASILYKFEALVNDLSIGLPAELAARRKQYEHYRDRLLTFEERPA